MSIRQLLLWGGLLLPLAAAAQTPAPRDISLNQALQAAQDNLEVRLARRNLAGAQADVSSADRAPFPVLSASISEIDLQNGNGRGNVLQDRSYDKSVGLDWTWERGNKRELRTLSAQRAADAAQADLDETGLQQRLAALGGFYDLLSAQERLGEITQLERNAAELARVAARRLQAGDLSAQETARTEICGAHRASARAWPDCICLHVRPSVRSRRQRVLGVRSSATCDRASNHRSTHYRSPSRTLPPSNVMVRGSHRTRSESSAIATYSFA